MTSPRVKIYDQADQASREVARTIVQSLQQIPRQEAAVLGLPTGSTPLGLYREWVRMHSQEGLDWSKVTTFNLDEYWPMPATDAHSFHWFMQQNLWRPAGFDPAATHMPGGEIAQQSIEDHCAKYEQQMASLGGILIQVLGIGCNGHLGFNEPGAAADSRTRKVALAETTRRRAEPSFAPQAVPKFGISMGLGTILESKTIYLMAFGADKAEAVGRAIQGPVTAECPASLLQTHAAVHWVLDSAAASQLRP
jgi:glucosamine-6-phosphate deaminase